jgi:hypothetical protein
MRSERGQMVVEMILIMIVLLGIAALTTQTLKSSGFLNKMINAPWNQLAGMLQNGVWGPPSKTNKLHPNGYFRHISLEGERAK